ncbi:MAG: Ig-like domain-containing protein [Solirubrobacterales bacterium]
MKPRLAIALAVISAFLVFAPSSIAAPGDVEFYPPGPTTYVNAAPTINWTAYGALTSATCEFSKLSPSASTPFATASCSVVALNAPTVDSSLAPTSVSYTWATAPMVSGDGHYRVTYVPTFTSFPTLTATRDFVVDTVNPVVTASAPNGVTTDNTPQLGYTSQDVNPDTTLCAIDPVEPIVPGVFDGFSTCPASPYSIPAVADGDHKFFVVSQDKVGNYGYALRTFTVDANGPVINVTGLTAGEVLTTAWAQLGVSSSDVGTGVETITCAYDSNAPSNCSDSAFLNAPLEDGAHTLYVVATDVAGNVSRVTLPFTIDTTGGLKQGLVAPKTAKFAVRRGKLTRAKYATTMTASFALAAGAPAPACSGSAKIRALVKKKQIGSASAKFKMSGSRCVATAKTKLPRKFKGKKLSLTFAYKSGPIKAFTLYGRAKL